MTETTVTILTQYPFQILLMAAVAHRVVRDAFESLAEGRRSGGLRKAATRRQAT